MSKTQALNKLMFVVGLLFILLVALQSHGAPVHHNMQVELHPGLKMLKAKDTVTFAKGTPRRLSFLLHKELQVSVISHDDSLTLLHPATATEPYAEYGLQLGNQDNKVTLNYFGIIFDPITNEMSNGLISPDGATLFGSTYWYPFFLDTQKSFDITVITPSSWHSLIQGQLTSTQIEGAFRKNRFMEIYPQEEIYLVAGPFFNFETTTKEGKKIQILLRKNEPALAQTFLSLVPQYLEQYANWLAPYPYASFSVVENLWETGYGMPGFTLLGPSVIRLPFILNSSLPHEVLHNWWGNSVYVDYEKGNWSEGLTTYMSDYWHQEKIGNDRTYRLNTLATYDDFVTKNPGKDFPVRQFRGRHNSSSQAVGYGKLMMLFQMLEFRFGKDIVQKSLQNFYLENLFKRASFQNIQDSFEKITQQNLSAFFAQWLDREGAPRIELTDVKVMRWLDGSFSTTYSLAQTQEQPYELNIPVLWKLESGEEIRQIAKLNNKTQIFSLLTKSRPKTIAVDHDFNVFRQLYTEERPATLSSLFGAPLVHLHFDPNTNDSAQFAQTWARSMEGVSQIHRAGAKLNVALNTSSVLIGNHPDFAAFMQEQLSDHSFSVADDTISLQGQDFKLADVSTVVIARLKSNPQHTVVWVRWSTDNNPLEWAGRLTHYGTFGILAFKGRPAVLKSTWPVTTSPLQRSL